jgi:hypothetical protein
MQKSEGSIEEAAVNSSNLKMGVDGESLNSNVMTSNAADVNRIDSVVSTTDKPLCVSENIEPLQVRCKIMLNFECEDKKVTVTLITHTQIICEQLDW